MINVFQNDYVIYINCSHYGNGITKISVLASILKRNYFAVYYKAQISK